MNRREFLLSVGALPFLATIAGCNSDTVQNNEQFTVSLFDLGDLIGPDENGLMLPKGFSSRIVARSSEFVENTNYVWHSAPDGGACFPSDDGGWVYVSNAERARGNGGVSALRFNQYGDIIGAYSILEGTNRNCSGGVTPDHKWLSCEENWRDGRVFECDPYGIDSPVELKGLGKFNHEAIAYDTENHTLYLTEDERDGCLYRYTPNTQGDYQNGELEALCATNGNLHWEKITDPSATSQHTRHQLENTYKFNGGEGIAYKDGVIVFVTKGDDRVWAYDVYTETLVVLYDKTSSDNPILSAVDNVTVNALSEFLVCEDGGGMQIVAVNTKGQVKPFLKLVGHEKSELTGVAFSPNGDRLYFSSQRGTENNGHKGITFEVTGPFKAQL